MTEPYSLSPIYLQGWISELFDCQLCVYRLSQVFEFLFEGVDLLVLICQQHQQVILLLLGLLDLSLQFGLLRLQDGHSARD